MDDLEVEKIIQELAGSFQDQLLQSYDDCITTLSRGKYGPHIACINIISKKHNIIILFYDDSVKIANQQKSYAFFPDDAEIDITISYADPNFNIDNLKKIILAELSREEQESK